MDSTDISDVQAVALLGQIGQRLRYFRALRRRMESRSFPERDPVYRSAVDAETAVRELYEQVANGCPKGVGRRALRRSRAERG